MTTRRRPAHARGKDPAPNRPKARRRTLSENDARNATEETPESTPWLLLLGAFVGLGLATVGLLERRAEEATLPEDAAAMVGESTIRRVDYERVLAGVAGDLRSPVDEAMRRRVLDRMIDEELLVQRALDMGLAAIDRRVRGDLTSGLIASIVSETEGEEPDAADVARHYEENVDFFTRPGRLRARTVYFSSHRDGQDPRGDAATRAASARERIAAGESVDAVEMALGDTQVSPIPNTLLPAAKVRDYAGPSVLAAIMALEPGVLSEPIVTGSGVHLAVLLEREPRVVPALDEIESLVRQDLKRRRGDEALRTYIDRLKDEVPIRIDESIFEAPVAASDMKRDEKPDETQGAG